MSKLYEFGFQFSQPANMDSDMYSGVIKRLDEVEQIFTAVSKQAKETADSRLLTEPGKHNRRQELTEHAERQFSELEKSKSWTGYTENIKEHEKGIAENWTPIFGQAAKWDFRSIISERRSGSEEEHTT